jgi:hypothetical protein
MADLNPNRKAATKGGSMLGDFGLRIADCGISAAFSKGPSAGPVYDMKAISNCGMGKANFRCSDFEATGNL